jgi:hypothetical protein
MKYKFSPRLNWGLVEGFTVLRPRDDLLVFQVDLYKAADASNVIAAGIADGLNRSSVSWNFGPVRKDSRSIGTEPNKFNFRRFLLETEINPNKTTSNVLRVHEEVVQSSIDFSVFQTEVKEKGEVSVVDTHTFKTSQNVELYATKQMFVAKCDNVADSYVNSPFNTDTRLKVLLTILRIARRLPLETAFSKEVAGKMLWLAYSSIVTLIEKNATVFLSLVLSKGYIKGLLRICFLICLRAIRNKVTIVPPLDNFISALALRMRKYRDILSDYQREKFDEYLVFFVGHDCYHGDFFIRPNKYTPYGLEEYRTTPLDSPTNRTRHATVLGDREVPLFVCYLIYTNRKQSYHVDKLVYEPLGYSRDLLAAHTYQGGTLNLLTRYPKKYDRSTGEPQSETFFDERFMAWFEQVRKGVTERGKVVYNRANETLPPGFIFMNSFSSASDYAHVAFALPNSLFLNFVEILDAVDLVKYLE